MGGKHGIQVGGAMCPSWRIWKSMGRIIPYIMENKHVWNHQPALFYPYEMGITTMGSGRSPHFVQVKSSTSNIWVRKMDHDASRKHAWVVPTPRTAEKTVILLVGLYCIYIHIYLHYISTNIHIYIYMFIPHYVFDWNLKPSHIWVLAIKNCISLHAKKSHVSCERKKSGGPPEIWGFNRFMSCQLGSFKIQHDGWRSAQTGGYKGG